jgi:phage/plasmid-like protein (TIGR03299 family)
MAHGITETDKMFYVGEMPWHKLGVELPSLATAREAIEATGIDWKVYKEQVYSSQGKILKDYFLTIRDDTQEPLGCVGNLYNPLQNIEAFQFFDAVTQDPNGPKYETAGSLFGGRRIWIMARLPGFIQITKSDVIQEYIVLTNRHDGRGAVEMFWSPIRVVCNNTLTYAINSKGAGVKFRHIGEIANKVTAAQDALAIAQENHNDLIGLIQGMVDYEPTKQEVETVLEKLLPTAEGKLVVSTQTKNAREKVRELISVGAGNAEPGIEGTLWAVYNGITEYADHVKVIRPREGQDINEARLNSLWWGSSAEFKTKALEECAKLITNN